MESPQTNEELIEFARTFALLKLIKEYLNEGSLKTINKIKEIL